MDGGPGNLRQFPMSCISKMMTKESYGDSHMNHLHVLDVNKKGYNKQKNAMYADVYHRMKIIYNNIIYPNLQITRTIKFTNHMERSEVMDILEK